MEIPKNIEKIISNLETKKESEKEKFESGKLNFAIFFSDEKIDLENEISNLENETGYKIFISKDKKLADKLKVPIPGMIAYNRDESVIYRLKYTNLIKMLNIVRSPIYSPATTTNIGFYEDSGLPTFYIFSEKFDNSFYPIAYEMREKAKIGHLEFTEKINLRHFDIKKEDLPAVISISNRKKYRQLKITPEKLKIFITEFLDNKLMPFFLSQEEPKNNDGPVKIITRENYKKYLDDTIFVFHAPYCGFCIKLKPTIETLGNLLTKYSKIKVGTIDMTLNDMPEFDIKGYPTIIFKGKEYVKEGDVDGSRSLEDLLRFIKNVSGVDISEKMSKKEKISISGKTEL